LRSRAAAAVGAASAAALVLVGDGVAAKPPPIAFADRGSTIVLAAPGYRLTLSKQNGKVVTLVDRNGVELLAGVQRCLWGALSNNDLSYVGGCSFAPRSSRAFSYRWQNAASTLTLDYRARGFGSVVVTLRAHADYFDLRMTFVNREGIRSRIRFPDGLTGDTRTVSAGYAPNVLPGVQLNPGFFSRVGSNVEIYPSRWAFADYLALDVGDGHVSLYSLVNGPIYAVELGFLHRAAPSPCSGNTYCLVHEFEVWVRKGQTWTSPVVRVRVGATVAQSLLDYRRAGGIDRYPSLASKLGPRLRALAQAPLIKADLQLLKPFSTWASDLRRLPSPALLHPVAFTAGGHDASDPDFLPPDPRSGTDADFRAMIDAAHGQGDLVMPYLNLSWWDPASPTMRSLPTPLTTKDVAVLDPHGKPVTIDYGTHTGVIVSAFAPFVRRRVAQEMEQWRSEVPVDCVFLDQLGARPWLRDFNAASPNPGDYDDGWLALMAPYANRCLMVEDGWDRLARGFTGFHGSLLMMARELDLPNTFFGNGNWQPYPLADWLFHDKVLLYEHDLFDGTLANDGEVLLWNMAFGMVSSFAWTGDASLTSPWLDLAALLQRDVGPLYAGVQLSDYKSLAQQVTRSVFGDLTVDGNWSSTSTYADGGYDVAPLGFFAQTKDGDVLAGAFQGAFNGTALAAGTHYLVVERSAASVTVHQPVGAETDVAITPPATWSSGQPLHATALAADGSPLGTNTGRFENGRFVFHYAAGVPAYRIGS
jgi:hypothetical protein